LQSLLAVGDFSLQAWRGCKLLGSLQELTGSIALPEQGFLEKVGAEIVG
jgi:hypothetical protein